MRSLGWEDPLEEGMATNSSILAWRIPGTEEPGGLQVYRVAHSRTRLERLSTHIARQCAVIANSDSGYIESLMGFILLQEDLNMYTCWIIVFDTENGNSLHSVQQQSGWAHYGTFFTKQYITIQYKHKMYCFTEFEFMSTWGNVRGITKEKKLKARYVNVIYYSML